MNAPDPQNETRAKPGRGLFDELGTTVRELFDFTRRLLSDGNSRRLVIYNPQGRRLIRAPLNASAILGGIVTIWAPELAVLLAVGAVVARFSFVVEKTEPEQQIERRENPPEDAD